MQKNAIRNAVLFLLVAAAGAAVAIAAAPVPASDATGEVVNGLRLDLSAAARPDGQPKLRIQITNAGDAPLDLPDRAPLFLEVAGADGRWQSYQHPAWRSDKLGKAIRFERGHSESESEAVSAFAALAPGQYKVRVGMSLDAGMLSGYAEKNLWTGIVRSNIVTITIPGK
jgi:hypothetical protein